MNAAAGAHVGKRARACLTETQEEEEEEAAAVVVVAGGGEEEIKSRAVRRS